MTHSPPQPQCTTCQPIKAEACTTSGAKVTEERASAIEASSTQPDKRLHLGAALIECLAVVPFAKLGMPDVSRPAKPSKCEVEEPVKRPAIGRAVGWAVKRPGGRPGGLSGGRTRDGRTVRPDKRIDMIP